VGTDVVEAERTSLEETAVQQLEAQLRGELLRPASPGYDEARTVFNAMIDHRPALIARCGGVADVIAAVAFARANGLLASVRAGGHNVTGNAICDGGLVIDVSGMKGLWIDPGGRTIRAEPGLTWGELNQDLQTFGLAATGGYVSTTGIPGLTLGGGMGWLIRKHGLACDNLRSADVVTADGELIQASPTSNDDLFWALRGGGGNFGIVTSFEFDVHPAGVVQAGLFVYPASAATEVIPFWRDYARAAPEELTSGVLLVTAPAAPFVPAQAHGAPVLAIFVVYAGALDVAAEALRPLREFGPPLLDLVQPMPYSAVQTMADILWPPGSLNYWKSGFMNEPSQEAVAILLDFFARAPSPLDTIVLDHIGDGAMNRVGEGETAFGQRGFAFNLLVTALWSDPADSEENVGWTRELWDAMRPYTSDAAYLNYVGDEGEERVKASYGRSNYERLVALKQKYDSTNFFRLNQNIAP
jgi:FAD/FMN-containing dehydrogenase